VLVWPKPFKSREKMRAKRYRSALGMIEAPLYVSAMHRTDLAIALGIIGLLAVPAHAQSSSKPAPTHAKHAQATAALPEPKRLGAADSWIAYSSPEKGGHICYIVGQPAKSEPAGVKREAIHLLVTHNTADKTSNVVSFIAGYKFKDGSAAEVSVGDKKFDLFTKDDTAWARDSATDKAIVEAMQKGRQAIIKGSPAKGAATVDAYNLAGFGQVLGDIDKACGVKR
jgi:hypothetical protein